jgi:hypothetical protein
MKISPQITQINTDYKKIKNQCNQCNLWAFFFNTSPGEARIMMAPTYRPFSLLG